MSVDFLDSNIFLYSFDSENPGKQQTASRILDSAALVRSAAISFQVVQEVLNGMTRRVRPSMETLDVRRFFDRFLEPLWDVMPSRRLYDHAFDLHSRYRYSFYDSLIVAAALEAGCDRLLSEDFQDGQVIESLRIENPFLNL
jgi:predicted nucleic acid-binding protein